MYTPWGESQTIEIIAPGVRWVTTASHGGLMIAVNIAARDLTVSALQVAHPGVCGPYIYFEEDCSYAVAFFEHPEWKRTLERLALDSWHKPGFASGAYMERAKAEAIPRLEAEIAKSDSEIREDMRQIVKEWNQEYFQAPVS